MEWPNSAELCRLVRDTTADNVVLQFSRGKDAIGAWLELRRHFRTITPVFLYLCPGMEFEDQSLEYYETFFGERIVRMPHPSLYRMLNNEVFQHEWNREVIFGNELPEFDFVDVCRAVVEDHGLPPMTQAALGVRANDSIVRRISIKKNGPWNKKNGQFFPIWDWSAERLREEIRAAGVKLPIDYTWFGRSFDGIDARFTGPLLRHAPEDFAKLKELFPLIESDLKRYEYSRRAGDHG